MGPGEVLFSTGRRLVGFAVRGSPELTNSVQRIDGGSSWSIEGLSSVL